MSDLMNLEGARVLNKAEQKSIVGGLIPGKCNYSNGNTGQSCDTHSDCTNPSAVCHRGCCNTWV